MLSRIEKVIILAEIAASSFGGWAQRCLRPTMQIQLIHIFFSNNSNKLKRSNFIAEQRQLFLITLPP